MRRFSARVAYDPDLDLTATKEGRAALARFRNRPEWKKENSAHKAGNSLRKKAATQRAARKGLRERREEAEQRLAETLRRVVQALEMGMAELKEIGNVSGGYQRSVNQLQIHNALVFLKNKCGVRFEPGDYMQTVALDREHVAKGYVPLYDRMKQEEDGRFDDIMQRGFR